MPLSLSRSILSSTWDCISLSVSSPVFSMIRSARVDLPWSICAIIQKLRILFWSVTLRFSSSLSSMYISSHLCFIISHQRFTSPDVYEPPLFPGSGRLCLPGKHSVQDIRKRFHGVFYLLHRIRLGPRLQKQGSWFQMKIVPQRRQIYSPV